MDPFAGQRGDSPGTDQDAAIPVGEEPEVAARVAFVGPRPGNGVGEADLSSGGVNAAGDSLGVVSPTAAISGSANITRGIP